MTDADKRILYSLLPGVMFVALMWLVSLMSYSMQVPLAQFGIFPHRVTALPGILLAPLIHGNLMHLLSNSFPLIVLSAIILFSYPRVALAVFGGVYLLSGLWTWTFGRAAFHIGASGLVYGLAGFLFFSGLFRGDRNSLAISFIVLFLYGSFVYGILPTDGAVSYEAHIGGVLAGAGLAFHFRKVDLPKPEEEEDEDAEQAEDEGAEVLANEQLNHPEQEEQHEQELTTESMPVAAKQEDGQPAQEKNQVSTTDPQGRRFVYHFQRTPESNTDE